MSEFKVNTITNKDGSYGPQVCGITTFGSSGLQLPSGPTDFRGGRGRAVFLRGYVPGTNNTIDFVNIATKGDAQDFGDTVGSYVQFAAAGSATRGIVSGANTPAGESYYFTFSTTGTVVDFGNQTAVRRGCGACNDSTRALFAGGKQNPSPASIFYNVIDFFTFSTTGDANGFGDLTINTRQRAGCSSPTRGLFASGFDSPTNYNVIDYITIATQGNAIDFGDTLQTAVHNTGTACSKTRALFAGGYHYDTATSNVISFATIATTGNAIDFGDLTAPGSIGNDGAASDINGGLG